MESKTQLKGGRDRFFLFFLLSLLILNFSIEGYWKIKPYSFQSYFKNVWEICHEEGYNENYCILVDFSRPSGKDQTAIIGLKASSVLDTGSYTHGREKGNSARRPVFSDKEENRCSSLGAFKVAEKSYSATIELRFALDGSDASSSNARRRNILIRSSRYVGIMHHLISYLPLSDVSWGYFTTGPTMLRKIEALYGKSKKPILLYAYE